MNLLGFTKKSPTAQAEEALQQKLQKAYVRWLELWLQENLNLDLAQDKRIALHPASGFSVFDPLKQQQDLSVMELFASRLFIDKSTLEVNPEPAQRQVAKEDRLILAIDCNGKAYLKFKPHDAQFLPLILEDWVEEHLRGSNSPILSEYIRIKSHFDKKRMRQIPFNQSDSLVTSWWEKYLVQDSATFRIEESGLLLLLDNRSAIIDDQLPIPFNYFMNSSFLSPGQIYVSRQVPSSNLAEIKGASIYWLKEGVANYNNGGLYSQHAQSPQLMTEHAVALRHNFGARFDEKFIDALSAEAAAILQGFKSSLKCAKTSKDKDSVAWVKWIGQISTKTYLKVLAHKVATIFPENPQIVWASIFEKLGCEVEMPALRALPAPLPTMIANADQQKKR